MLFLSHFETDGETYEIADTSKRGRGSDSVDKASLYKVAPEQAAAISAFNKFANSSEGAAKVHPSHPQPHYPPGNPPTQPPHPPPTLTPTHCPTPGHPR